jgi:hypothetical protein
LPTVKCKCGKEILLVPDAKVIGEAIEAHVERHKCKVKDPAKAEEEAEHIREYLTLRVLEKAGSLFSKKKS